MPELPEVQVVINYLKKNILNLSIKKVDIHLNKIIKNCTPEEFKTFFKSRKIVDIQRRGKYLIFILDNNKCLVSHLRMEGKFFFIDNDYKLTKHDHVVFEFDNKKMLVYNDTRQFGTMNIYQSVQSAYDGIELAKLGPEPFSEQFTLNYFKQKVLNSKKHIKTFLLDQTNVVGIGNIYADEILFSCKIHPLTKCDKLSTKDVDNMIVHTKRILNESIKHNGTTVHSFKFNQLSTGEYQKMLQVHLRKNQQCYVCGNKINKIEVNNRGTYFCPHCQKEKK